MAKITRLIDLVKKHKNKPWNWSLLTQNPNISSHDIFENLDLSWDYEDASKNVSILNDFINNRKEDHKTTVYIRAGLGEFPEDDLCVCLTKKDLDNHYDFFFSKDDNFEKMLKLYCEDIEDLFVDIDHSENLLYKFNKAKEYGSEEEIMSGLSKNYNLTYDFVKKNKNEKWVPFELCKTLPLKDFYDYCKNNNLNVKDYIYCIIENPFLTFDEYIDIIREFKLDFDDIMYSHINFTDIENILRHSKELNLFSNKNIFYYASDNVNLSFDFIDEFIDESWCFSSLSSNSFEYAYDPYSYDIFKRKQFNKFKMRLVHFQNMEKHYDSILNNFILNDDIMSIVKGFLF